MSQSQPAPIEVADLAPGWLQRLAAVGWRLLVAIALGVVLLRIALVVSTVTASILAIIAVIAIAFLPYIADFLDAIKSGVSTIQRLLADASVAPEIGKAID